MQPLFINDPYLHISRAVKSFQSIMRCNLALAAWRGKYAMHKLSMSANMKKRQKWHDFFDNLLTASSDVKQLVCNAKFPRIFFFSKAQGKTKTWTLARRNFHISNHKLIRVRAKTHTQKAIWIYFIRFERYVWSILLIASFSLYVYMLFPSLKCSICGYSFSRKVFY